MVFYLIPAEIQLDAERISSDNENGVTRMDVQPITRWIIPISGFSQHPNQRTGMSELALKMHEGIGKEPGCWVHPVLVWNADWESLARSIQVNSCRDAKIFIVAYSWGAGWGSVQLARCLRKIGMEVEAMFLCDPVYRSRFWCMTWRSRLTKNSLLSWLVPVVKIPSNVKLVDWTRQFEDWPQGHDLVEASPSTVIPPAIIEQGVIHNQMDESETFHNLVLEGVSQ